MTKRFFYGRGDIIRLINVHTNESEKWGKYVVAVFEEKGSHGTIEMNRFFTPEEWILAERELMEMQIPGVEVDLFDTEDKGD